MRVHTLLLVCAILCIIFPNALDARSPIWKVFCHNDPIFRGRADPIVEPGILAQHSHKVFGANNFGIGAKGTSDIDYFNYIRSSTCTSCSITADMSNYWIGDLYYDWGNGTFSLVPSGGLTVYYLSRAGSGNQSNPDWQPFPPGLRMTSGSPTRRSYSGTVKEKAISYACISGQPSVPETPYFPTNGSVCQGGLRAQVWFPMCWDGVRLDSPNHQDHMSHPEGGRPDGGNCPATHPVRVPGVFFEVLFDVNNARFPHGNGRNPFVWAHGDPTGYGLHGDFLNGWDTEVVRAALAHPDCDNGNPAMNFGNNVRSCPPLAPFVQENTGLCKLNPDAKVNTFEDLGLNHLINKLPGCNPVNAGPATVVPCFDPPGPVTLTPGVKRVLIRGSNDLYWTTRDTSKPITVSASRTGLVSYSEIFLMVATGTGYSIMSEGSERYLRAVSSGSEDIQAGTGGVSTWETFNLVENADGTFSIQAQSNSRYISLTTGGFLRNNAQTIGANEKFTFVNANSETQAAVPPQPINLPTSSTIGSPTAPPRPTTSTASSTASSGSYSGDANPTASPSSTGALNEVDGSAVQVGASFFFALSLLAALLL